MTQYHIRLCYGRRLCMIGILVMFISYATFYHQAPYPRLQYQPNTVNNNNRSEQNLPSDPNTVINNPKSKHNLPLDQNTVINNPKSKHNLPSDQNTVIINPKSEHNLPSDPNTVNNNNRSEQNLPLDQNTVINNPKSEHNLPSDQNTVINNPKSKHNLPSDPNTVINNPKSKHNLPSDPNTVINNPKSKHNLPSDPNTVINNPKSKHNLPSDQNTVIINPKSKHNLPSDQNTVIINPKSKHNLPLDPNTVINNPKSKHNLPSDPNTVINNPKSKHNLPSDQNTVINNPKSKHNLPSDPNTVINNPKSKHNLPSDQNTVINNPKSKHNLPSDQNTVINNPKSKHNLPSDQNTVIINPKSKHNLPLDPNTVINNPKSKHNLPSDQNTVIINPKSKHNLPSDQNTVIINPKSKHNLPLDPNTVINNPKSKHNLPSDPNTVINNPKSKHNLPSDQNTVINNPKSKHNLPSDPNTVINNPKSKHNLPSDQNTVINNPKSKHNLPSDPNTVINNPKSKHNLPSDQNTVIINPYKPGTTRLLRGSTVDRRQNTFTGQNTYHGYFRANKLLDLLKKTRKQGESQRQNISDGISLEALSKSLLLNVSLTGLIKHNHNSVSYGFVKNTKTRRDSFNTNRSPSVKTAQDKRVHIPHLVLPKPTSEPLPVLVGNTIIRCDKLMDGDKEENERAYQKQRTHAYTYPSAHELLEMARNCGDFKKTMGYLDQPSSQDENQFPLAYGIRMHKNSAQAERLLRAIYQPQNIYCIYIDLKSDGSIHRAMRQIAECFDNVFIASQLDVFTYGTFSAIQADVQCMRDALTTSVQWTYFMNLAGQEFPLRTNLELVTILQELNGTNEIENYPYNDLYKHRFNRIHTIIDGVLQPTNITKEPFIYKNKTIPLHKGSSYNCFSRAFVEWVLVDDLPAELLQWSRDTDSPDELVWATLNHQPEAPGGYPVMITQTSKTALAREVIWEFAGPGYCHSNYFVHGICILSAGDLNWLSKRWEFFANKFDLNVDHVAMDCLEKVLERRRLNPDTDESIDWERIRNLPHFMYSRHIHNGEPLPDYFNALVAP